MLLHLSNLSKYHESYLAKSDQNPSHIDVFLCQISKFAPLQKDLWEMLWRCCAVLESVNRRSVLLQRN